MVTNTTDHHIAPPPRSLRPNLNSASATVMSHRYRHQHLPLSQPSTATTTPPNTISSPCIANQKSGFIDHLSKFTDIFTSIKDDTYCNQSGHITLQYALKTSEKRTEALENVIRSMKKAEKRVRTELCRKMEMERMSSLRPLLQNLENGQHLSII
ncbi:hypothetical protein L2E82_19411 [Cichorium intybus]|uniref:Uncharacterized protein n=1 Tax=Cichorium intybus TaxID=13427 RepID=A0ACB9FCE3_CICIN|nr:hypothetical protein L2E82_19411 [Cichorium intybus]